MPHSQTPSHLPQYKIESLLSGEVASERLDLGMLEIAGGRDVPLRVGTVGKFA